MFLDVRDQWPPVPPPPQVPEQRQPLLNRRGERVVGLIVAINVGLLLLAPVAGSSVAEAISAVVAAFHH